MQAENVNLRACAARALGQMGEPEAVKPLMNMLANDRDAWARSWAAESLGVLGDASTTGSLLEKALQDEDSSVRAAAASSLGHLNVTNAGPLLVSALSEDLSPNVRSAAAFALVEINDANAIKDLVSNLNDRDEDACLAAAAALIMLGNTNGLEVLRQSLRGWTWQPFTVVVSLGRWNTPLAHEILQGQLHDSVLGIRKLALAAQSGRTAQGLAELLRDHDADMRDHAACALVFFNDPATLPALQEACKDTNPNVRFNARLSLRRIERLQTPKAQNPPPAGNR
jgi:HEAT repeat protein